MSSSSAATVADRLGEALAAARRMGFAPVVGLLSTDQVAERRCLLKGRTDSAPEEMHVPATTAPSCGWGVARPLILIVAASLTTQHINDRLRGLRVEARRRSGFEMEHSTRTAGSISDDPSRGWSRRGKKAWTYETVGPASGRRSSAGCACSSTRRRVGRRHGPRRSEPPTRRRQAGGH